jgi:hypothetical protein
VSPSRDVGAALERGRRAAGLTQDELWARYWQAGGRAKRSAVLSYLRGNTEPQVAQYNLLAETINDALVERGKRRSLPILEFD